MWSWRGLDSWKCLIDLLIVYFYWLIWFDWLVQEVNVILITLESWRWLMDGLIDWLIDWYTTSKLFIKNVAIPWMLGIRKRGMAQIWSRGLALRNYKKKSTLILHSEGQGWKTRNGEDLKLQSTTGPFGHPCNLWFDLVWLINWLIYYDIYRLKYI